MVSLWRLSGRPNGTSPQENRVGPVTNTARKRNQHVAMLQSPTSYMAATMDLSQGHELACEEREHHL